MKKTNYLFALLLTLIVGQAKAQTYQLSPLIREIEIAPGESKTIDINVRNQTKEKLTGYQMKLEEFFYNEKSGRVDYSDQKGKKNPKSLVAFSKLSQTKFDIEPKTPTIIKLIITVPKDMKGSGYLRYTVVQSPGRSLKKGIQILQNLTGSVLVKIKGTEEKKFELVDLKYKGNLVSFDLKNAGNTYLKLKANAFVLKSNKKTTKIKVLSKNNDVDFYLFPDSSRTLFFNVDPKLMEKKGKTKILINFFDSATGFTLSKTVEVSK